MKNLNSNVLFDLAEQGHPISNMFEQPKSAKDWEQYILTEEQVTAFKNDGFVKGIKILTEEQVDILNHELIRLQSLSPEEKTLFYHYESNESEDFLHRFDNVAFCTLPQVMGAPGDRFWNSFTICIRKTK